MPHFHLYSEISNARSLAFFICQSWQHYTLHTHTHTTRKISCNLRVSSERDDVRLLLPPLLSSDESPLSSAERLRAHPLVQPPPRLPVSGSRSSPLAGLLVLLTKSDWNRIPWLSICFKRFPNANK